MPPTTLIETSGCFLSYSATIFLKTVSSRDDQPTHTFSFVTDVSARAVLWIRAPGRHLEADRVARAALARGCEARARGLARAGRPELRRGVLRARARCRVRARPRPWFALSPRSGRRSRRTDPRTSRRRTSRRR